MAQPLVTRLDAYPLKLLVQPKTTIDSRYSDPKARAISWDETCHLMESAELFWICTVRADGRPHATPLVATWVDEAIHFHTGAHEQKFANLRENPSVVLLTGCNQWDRGIDVVVEGEAVHVTDRAVLERLSTSWASKWDGRWQLTAGDGGFHHPGSEDYLSQVFSVVPTTAYAFAKEPFGQTRHRF